MCVSVNFECAYKEQCEKDYLGLREEIEDRERELKRKKRRRKRSNSIHLNIFLIFVHFIQRWFSLVVDIIIFEIVECIIIIGLHFIGIDFINGNAKWIRCDQFC